MELGVKIRNMLKERRIKQMEFQETTGINRTTLMPIGHRRKTWKKTTVYAVACFFGMSIEELVKGTDMEDMF